MLLLGLTGGVGMGKSTCADLLKQRTVPVIDTDELARELVQPGQPLLAEIQRAFGPEIVDPAGGLRRDLLARKVFADPAARQRLESILHPPIRQRWLAQAQSWRAQNLRLGVVVIPLLFETRAEAELDRVVCVACSSSTQRSRLRARGWSDEQAQQRIRAQWPVEKKIAAANHVIWSEGSIEIHAAQLNRILSGL